jgi:hypothetical protein
VVNQTPDPEWVPPTLDESLVEGQLLRYAVIRGSFGRNFRVFGSYGAGIKSSDADPRARPHRRQGSP